MATNLEHCIITNHKSIEYWQDSPYPPNAPETYTIPNTFLIVIQPNQDLVGPNGETNGYWAVDARDFTIANAPAGDGNGSDWWDAWGGEYFMDMFFSEPSCGDVNPSLNIIDTDTFTATSDGNDSGNEDNTGFLQLNLLYKSLKAANDVQMFTQEIEMFDTSGDVPGSNIGQLLSIDPDFNNDPFAGDWCVCCDTDATPGLSNLGIVDWNEFNVNNIVSGTEHCNNFYHYVNMFRYLNLNRRIDKIYGLGSSLNIPNSSTWSDSETANWWPVTTWDLQSRGNLHQTWDDSVSLVGISNWYTSEQVDYDAPPESNVVLVWVRLKDEFQMPPEDHKIKIDINGDARWIETGPQGMPAFSTCEFDLISNSSNSATETITATSDATIVREVLNSGFSGNKYNYVKGEKTIYKISGKFKKNKPTTVAKIKIEANDGMFLPSYTYLNSYSKLKHLNVNSEDFIKLILTNTEETNNNITSLEYDLVYNNIKTVKRVDGLSANLNHKAISIPTRTNCLGQISVGGTIIADSGGAKLIKISGIPGSTFAINVDENIYDLESESYSEDGTKARVRQQVLDKSILDSSISTSRVDEYGNTKNIIEGVIDSSGSYSFTQKFPSSIVKKTKINGARDGVSSLILDDITGIKVGDRVIIRKTHSHAGIPDTNAVTTVSSLTPATNTIGVSSSVTAADNAGVVFKRRRTYSLNLIKDLSSTPCANTTTDFVFEQRLDPLLTLKVSTAGSAYKINGGGMGVASTSTYLGKAYKTANSLKANRRHEQIYDITYSLTNATSNFATVTSPIFNTHKDAVYDSDGNHIEGSHWSNSIPNENGGTKVNIQTVSVSAVGSTSLTIKVRLVVIKWGSKDVTMELNLDKILTLT